MKLPLHSIHPSANPVRTEVDEDKLAELTESIRSQGVIVPIKVRPNSNGSFEVVWGNRRLEAAKRAGLTEIEADIVDLDDTGCLTEALLENIVRHDMSEIDIAKGYQKLRELGVSVKEIAKRVGTTEPVINRFLRLAKDLAYYVNSSNWNEVSNMTDLVHKADVVRGLGDMNDCARVLEVVGQQGFDKVAKVAQAVRPLPSPDRQAVLDKAQAEDLAVAEIEQVAAVLAGAKSDDLRQAVLDTPAKAGGYEARVKARVQGEREEARLARKARRHHERFTDEVKATIEEIKRFHAWLPAIREALEYRRFSPEGRRYVAGRLHRLIALMTTIAEELDHEDTD